MYQVTVREPYCPELEVVYVEVEENYSPEMIRLVVYAQKPGM